MGDQLRGAPRARAQSIENHEGVAVATFRGVLTIARINDVMNEIAAMPARGEPLSAIVLDVQQIDGFEPGAPARIIHWLGVHASMIYAAVLVTPSPVLLATVRAAALLLPQTVYVAASSRAEAIGIAERLVNSRPRVSTDVHRRVLTATSSAASAVRKQTA